MIEVMLYAVKIKDKFLYEKKLLTARQTMLAGGKFLYSEVGRAKEAAMMARAQGGELIDAEVVRVHLTIQIRAIEFIGKHRKFRKPSKWDKKETTDADEREDTAA